MKFDNTEKTGPVSKAEMAKDEECIKELKDLMDRYGKKYGWELEKEPQNLGPYILIKTPLPVEDNSPLCEADDFKKELENILKKCGFKITEFCPTGVGIDGKTGRKNRRIDITLKREP